ncbi:MAG: ornithine cyclodeaminase family protein [Halobacteriales archaeon]
MVRVLSESAVDSLIELDALLDVIEDAFLAQGADAVERPERPHYPVGTGLRGDGSAEPLGTGLAMPAYIHGADYAVVKLVGVHGDNPSRGLPTVHAQVVLTEADTGRAAAFLAGTTLTNARTGCIGGVAVRALVDGPIELGVIGAGTQARWQTRAIDAAAGVATARIYSPSDSKRECAAELQEELDGEVTVAESARAAVEGVDVVVTATTATEPVFPGEAIAPGAIVVAIGAYTAETQELDGRTFDRADHVYADVPSEVAGIGDIINTGTDSDRLVPLSSLLVGADHPAAEDLVVVESVGSAVLDAAAAEAVLDRAYAANAGTEVEL